MIEEKPLCDRCRHVFAPSEEDEGRCDWCFSPHPEPDDSPEEPEEE